MFKKRRCYIKRKIAFILALLIFSKSNFINDSYCNDSPKPKIERLLKSEIYNSETEIISNSNHQKVVVGLRGGDSIDIGLCIVILKMLFKESVGFSPSNSNIPRSHIEVNSRVAPRVVTDFDQYNNRNQRNTCSKLKLQNQESSHLDVKFERDGVDFVISDKQAQKKLVRHGYDAGLEPMKNEYGEFLLDKKFGKPMVKLNRNNIETFKERIKEFSLNPDTQMLEGYFRKRVDSGYKAFHFYDPETSRVASFDKSNGKFISFWEMTKEQRVKFLETKNLF